MPKTVNAAVKAKVWTFEAKSIDPVNFFTISKCQLLKCGVVHNKLNDNNNNNNKNECHSNIIVDKLQGCRLPCKRCLKQDMDADFRRLFQK